MLRFIFNIVTRYSSSPECFYKHIDPSMSNSTLTSQCALMKARTKNLYSNSQWNHIDGFQTVFGNLQLSCRWFQIPNPLFFHVQPTHTHTHTYTFKNASQSLRHITTQFLTRLHIYVIILKE